MIVYDRFCFASPPRTATSWFVRACWIAGLGEGFKAQAHEPPTAPDPHRLIVSIVRHPYDWLCSYYHALKGGSIGVPCVDVFVDAVRANKDFESFVGQYLRELPGAVGEMFLKYNVSTSMRIEDLKWAAIEFFQSLDVKRDRLDRIKEILPLNANHSVPFTKHPRLRREVCKAETQFCEHYDYTPWY